jgi:Flp pilus assembly protein TadG
VTPHRRLVGTLLRARSGAASVEFAITFMVVLVAVLGIFELGFIFLSQRGIDRGVTESARWIAVNSATANATTVAPIFVAASTLALGSTAVATCTYAVTTTVPTITSGCAVNIVYPSGVTAPAPGVVVTVTAQFRWTPLTTLVNIAAITLISSAALTIQD